VKDTKQCKVSRMVITVNALFTLQVCCDFYAKALLGFGLVVLVSQLKVKSARWVLLSIARLLKERVAQKT
jgi:hypothetical protein